MPTRFAALVAVLLADIGARAFVPRGFGQPFTARLAPSSRAASARVVRLLAVRGSKVVAERDAALEKIAELERALAEAEERARAADDYRMATASVDFIARSRASGYCAENAIGMFAEEDARAETADAVAVEDAVVAEEAVAVAARVASASATGGVSSTTSLSDREVDHHIRPGAEASARAVADKVEQTVAAAAESAVESAEERAEAQAEPEDAQRRAADEANEEEARLRDAQAEEDDAQRRADESNEEEARERDAEAAAKRSAVEVSDYYFDLCVDRAADEATIKSSFRKLAREFHPDVNKEPGAQEKFKKISHAYEVLSDPEAKLRYDIYPLNWGGEEVDVDDILKSFFRGGRAARAARRRRRQAPMKGEDFCQHSQSFPFFSTERSAGHWC